MKAVVQSAYDEDFNSAVAFEPLFPVPEPDTTKRQVRVRVHYGAMNPIDQRLVRGDLAALLKQQLPSPIGRDFAGVVDYIPATGAARFAAEAAGLSVGDRVAGWLDHENLACGSFAELVVCDVKVLAKVPAEVPLRDAVCVPLAGNTVYIALVKNFGLKRGKCDDVKLLVLGGSSATGMLAIQLAKYVGVGDIVCTSTNVELCTSLGASRVVDYRATPEWWNELRGYGFDFVFDTVGGRDAWEQSRVVMKRPAGRFYTIVGDVNTGKMTVGRMLGAMCGAMCRGCCGGPRYQMGPALASDADSGLRFWLELLRAGHARAVRDTSTALCDADGVIEFSRDGVVAMLRKQASKRCRGKLVMKVAPDAEV